MKITFVFWSLEVGGVEKMMTRMMAHYADRHEVAFVHIRPPIDVPQVAVNSRVEVVHLGARNIAKETAISGSAESRSMASVSILPICASLPMHRRMSEAESSSIRPAVSKFKNRPKAGATHMGQLVLLL
jgi:hypothetical protein